MYTEVNGQRSPVKLNFKIEDTEPTPISVENYTDASTGSNKGWLIAALILSIIAVIVSSYLLYNAIKSDSRKQKESFGYRLY